MNEEHPNWLAGRPVEVGTTVPMPRGGWGFYQPRLPHESPDQYMWRKRQERRQLLGLPPLDIPVGGRL